jgi:hypothetical protein
MYSGVKTKGGPSSGSRTFRLPLKRWIEKKRLIRIKNLRFISSSSDRMKDSKGLFLNIGRDSEKFEKFVQLLN